jgi:hypothetical protein
MGNRWAVRDAFPIAFASAVSEPEQLEIRINFGVFAGREATQAELDQLGRAAMAEIGHVTVVSERRQELGGRTETSLHQVRMDVPQTALPEDAAEAEWLCERLVGLAERWAQRCIDSRHADVFEPVAVERSPVR